MPKWHNIICSNKALSALNSAIEILNRNKAWLIGAMKWKIALIED